MDRSYRDLEARKSRAKDLEKLYMDMSMQKELQVIALLYQFIFESYLGTFLT